MPKKVCIVRVKSILYLRKKGRKYFREKKNLKKVSKVWSYHNIITMKRYIEKGLERHSLIEIKRKFLNKEAREKKSKHRLKP